MTTLTTDQRLALLEEQGRATHSIASANSGTLTALQGAISELNRSVHELAVNVGKITANDERQEAEVKSLAEQVAHLLNARTVGTSASVTVVLNLLYAIWEAWPHK